MPITGLMNPAHYAGHTTHAYFDIMVGQRDNDPMTDEDPVWTEMENIRNFKMDKGPNLNKSPTHGSGTTGSIVGYNEVSGSFDYVRQLGTDTVFDYLEQRQEAGLPIMLRELNQAIDVVGAKGSDLPVYLGKFSETRDGENDVVTSIPFEFASVVDEDGVRIDRVPVVIAAP